MPPAENGGEAGMWDDIDTAPRTPASLPGTALAWIDPTTVKKKVRQSAPTVAPDLLSEVPLRRDRAAVVPVTIIAAIVAAYVAATAVWPTTALPPTVMAQTLSSAATPATVITWPEEGSAAIGISGGATASSTLERTQMASITKVISVMTVLEKLPLALGETGPSYDFTYADTQNYWRYITGNESALDVPVDGSLTEYQLIEGILLGSAGNYTDRLVQEAFETEDEFIEAANAWLTASGISGITIVEPTGIDYGNTATPASLVALGEVAMAHPVVAEIAGKASADIPGAGLVENSNGLIGDPGVVGLKTGTLDGWNLLSAKEFTVGETTILANAVVLDQRNDDARNDASRALYTQVEAALQPQIAVPQGTVVADVTTAWGAKTQLVTADDASAVLWQREATITKSTELTDDRTAGADAGTLTVNSTTGDDTVAVTLSNELEGPSFWWRLTHPLELFGLG